MYIESLFIKHIDEKIKFGPIIYIEITRNMLLFSKFVLTDKIYVAEKGVLSYVYIMVRSSVRIFMVLTITSFIHHLFQIYLCTYCLCFVIIVCMFVMQ